jgi:hypothetical protein
MMQIDGVNRIEFFKIIRATYNIKTVPNVDVNAGVDSEEVENKRRREVMQAAIDKGDAILTFINITTQRMIKGQNIWSRYSCCGL